MYSLGIGHLVEMLNGLCYIVLLRWVLLWPTYASNGSPGTHLLFWQPVLLEECQKGQIVFHYFLARIPYDFTWSGMNSQEIMNFVFIKFLFY